VAASRTRIWQNCRVSKGNPDPGTVTEHDLIERTGPLKADLVAFGRSERFAKEFRAAHTRFTAGGTGRQRDQINFLDRFVLEHRTRDGRTIVEQFVASRPDLPEAERTMLLGWTDVVESVFEVERHDGTATIMLNLVDELTYRVRSNVGPGVLDQFAPETVLSARVVPFDGDWLLSGTLSPAPPAGRREMCRVAGQIANTCPALVFRNPEKVALGWDLHQRMRGHFIDCFGADLTVVAGHELADRMDDFWKHHATRVRAAEQPASDEPVAVPHMSIPSELERAETVGIMFDEIEGLLFLPEYALVREVFADPGLIAGHRCREAVSGYLRSESIPPVVLRRLAEQDPDLASRVFARLLGKPRFTWQQGGEALLRRYKEHYFDRTALPGVTPLSDRQREFLRP